MTLITTSGWPGHLIMFENVGSCNSGPSHHTFDGISTGLHLFEYWTGRVMLPERSLRTRID